jgi:hypothetical protein
VPVVLEFRPIPVEDEEDIHLAKHTPVVLVVPYYLATAVPAGIGPDISLCFAESHTGLGAQGGKR